MLKTLLLLTLLIGFARISLAAGKVASDQSAPPEAASESGEEPAAKNRPTRPKLLEETSERDWTLLAYESQFGSIRGNSLHRFGDWHNVNLRALRAIGFHLREFNFWGADLRGADFTLADVRGANFRGADLSESVFLSTKETGAIFDEKTLLPFTEDEASKRGWVRFGAE